MDNGFFDAMRLLQNGYKLTGDLPITITEKMSDIEVLYNLTGMVSECQKQVENLAIETNAYTDTQIKTLREELLAQVDVLNNSINDCLKSAKNYTDEEIIKFTKKVSETTSNINNIIDGILTENAKLDNRVNELQKQITDANMNVVCPTCGIDMSIQDALYHIYNSIRVTISWLDFNEKVSSYTWESFDRKLNGATWLQFEYDLNNVLGLNETTINLENN